MKLRYFIAIKIVPEIVVKLKDFYKDNFLTELPVKNFHLTLVAPFFIKEGFSEDEVLGKIKEVKVYPFTAKFIGLDCFEQKGRNILYAKAEPEIEFKELWEKCNTVLRDLIEFDTLPYSEGKVPVFKAHATLDYDFREIIPENFPEISFDVEKIVVFKEENGVWASKQI